MNALAVVCKVLSLLTLLTAIAAVIPASRKKILEMFKREQTLRGISILFLIAGIIVLFLFMKTQFTLLNQIGFIQDMDVKPAYIIIDYITTPGFWMQTFIIFSSLMLIILGFFGVFKPSKILPYIEQEGSPLFNEASIDKWNIFVKSLKSDDPQLKRIYELLSDETRQIIDNFPEKGKLSDEEREQILNNLNEIVKKDDLYDENIFQEASSSGQMRKYLDAKFLNKLDEKTIPEFNRTLLEVVFKGRILDFTSPTLSTVFGILAIAFLAIAILTELISALNNPGGILNL